MSSSKSRNFRRRGGNDDGADENNDDTVVPKTQPKSTTPAAKPLKSSTPLSRSRLSFSDDGDEGGEATPPLKPIPRPSSSSKKPNSYSFTSSKTRKSGPGSVARPPLASNVKPQAGSYTPESLLELQKNTKTLPKTTAAPPSEPVIVFKGLVKPSSAGSGSSSIDHSAEKKRNQSVGDGAEEEEEDSIMDQARINAIKAQRERLRQAGPAAPDFISLDSGSNHGEAEGLSDEEPEFRGRIGFLGANVDGVKKGVFESYEERGVEKISLSENEAGEDEDDEDKLWEEEQARDRKSVV